MTSNHAGVYNIYNGQVAPDTVNVQNAFAIGSEQSRQFSASLSREIMRNAQGATKLFLL